jgi:glycosyltransferase involved in cell wall biosynthesis
VDTLTVVNESLIAPYVRVGVDKNRIHVVNNGVSFSESPIQTRAEKFGFRKELVEQLTSEEQRLLQPFAEDQWILYLARVATVKGQLEAHHVWGSLNSEARKKMILIIIGPEAETGTSAQLLKNFENAPDRERVIILGGTRTPHLWFSSSDLFISLSKFEGMPLGPMEAIGSGLPAVLSSIDGHRFLQTVSLQYAPNSPTDGALRIESILRDASFGTSGYYRELWEKSEWIRKQYSLGTMAENYARFYRG